MQEEYESEIHTWFQGVGARPLCLEQALQVQGHSYMAFANKVLRGLVLGSGEQLKRMHRPIPLSSILSSPSASLKPSAVEEPCPFLSTEVRATGAGFEV